MLKITSPLHYVQWLDPPLSGYTYGRVVAPAAGTVLCQTPAVSAGIYKISYMAAVADTVAPGALIDVSLYVEPAHLLLYQLAMIPAGAAIYVESRKTTFGGGTIRVEAISGIAGAAGSVYFAYIELRATV